MKNIHVMVLAACSAFLLAGAADSNAVTHHVSEAGSHTPPFLDWATAATNIQAAVDVALVGETVLVGDGVYDAGAHTAVGVALPSRVVVTRDIELRSANGAEQTVIVGRGGLGAQAVRCVYMSAGTLTGFTLSNGHTRVTGAFVDTDGGGAYLAGASMVDCRVTDCMAVSGGGVAGGTVSNCWITRNLATEYGGGLLESEIHASRIERNIATYGGGVFEAEIHTSRIERNSAAYGGGVFDCVLRGCSLFHNSAGDWGGGAFAGSLVHCTVVGNMAAAWGGGTYFSDATNSIIYYNTAREGANIFEGVYGYCCVPNVAGVGNFGDAPGLLSGSHLSPSSACVGRGAPGWAGGTDIDGDAWKASPAVGCDEPVGPYDGGLDVAISAETLSPVVGFESWLFADIAGEPAQVAWDFGDGQVVGDTLYAPHAWGATGVYDVVLTAFNIDMPGGVAATVTVHVCEQPVHYVDVNSGNPTPPFTNWATAATDIQAAVDAASRPGSLVLVAAGDYLDGRHAPPEGTNVCRVVITNNIVVASVAGADTTRILGSPDVGGGAVRALFMTTGTLRGFTVANGYTGNTGIDVDRSGGGAYISGATLEDCTLSDSQADFAGGGVFGGTLRRCRVLRNDAPEGGGVYRAIMSNCIIANNEASVRAGGASQSSLRNCTVYSNSAPEVGGVLDGTHVNTISYYNTAPVDPNGRGGYWQNCCTVPEPVQSTNTVTSAPLFEDAPNRDFRLQVTSPCIEAGLNLGGMETERDILGNARVFLGAVDIGATEFTMIGQFVALLEGAWEGAEMHAKLSDQKLVPRVSPYAVDRVVASAIATNTTDWVLVEVLRASDFSPAFVESAFLMRDGTIRSVDGNTGIVVEVAPGDYYLSIKHRNHLAQMSAAAVSFRDHQVSYAFDTGSEKFRGGTNAAVSLVGGKWATRAGDVDGDGMITLTDRAILQLQVGKTGYLAGDTDLDGVVTTSD